MASLVEENYLKALFNLVNEFGEIGMSELSTQLEVSKPSANSMMKNLHLKGLVHYEKYKPIHLTNKGKKAAALIVRKHRLTEMYLVEKMGFGWEQVHEVAEQIEHIQSDLFFRRMDELLDHPTVDPHGSPIPDSEGEIHWPNYTPLSECKAGDKVKLLALNQSSKSFLKFLNSKELELGIRLHVEYVEPFDSSIEVSYPGHPKEVLSVTAAEKLLVEKI